MNSVDAKMVMSDLYESTFGIYNHLSPDVNRPLASVAFHACEDFVTDSLLEGMTKTYADCRIGDHFKLNVLEFLDLPMDYIQSLIKLATNLEAAKTKGVDEVLNKLKAEDSK